MPPTPNRRNRTIIVLLLIIVALLLTLGIVCYRCRHSPSPCPCPPIKADTVHWAGWNILFKAGTPDVTRADVANKVDDHLRQLLVDNGIDTTKIHPIFTHYFCPCDPTLLNVDLTLINESGNPVTPSAPPNPPKPPSLGLGGSVIHNYFNTPMAIPEYANASSFQSPASLSPSFDSTWLQLSTSPPVTSNKILAILDTGLDSTEFKKKLGDVTYNYTGIISSLIWKDANQPTLFNTLVGADPGQLTDDETPFRHGTSVTYIALLAATHKSHPNLNTVAPPRIMVVKVLDSAGRGSVFTISCGMSYAIQKKATVINASLGYAGPLDSILQYYFKKANDSSIAVMVAAGNDTSKPHNLLCRSAPNVNDTIGGASPFYPACFSYTMPYVTTVTGVDPNLPCFFQKFSNTYVSVGVNLQTLSEGTPIPQACCSFFIPYLNGGEYVEGSSFSTPVIAGSYLYSLSVSTNLTAPPPPATWLTQPPFTINPGLKNYIQGGKYLTYAY